jgi:hypothetical protein
MTNVSQSRDCKYYYYKDSLCFTYRRGAFPHIKNLKSTRCKQIHTYIDINVQSSVSDSYRSVPNGPDPAHGTPLINNYLWNFNKTYPRKHKNYIVKMKELNFCCFLLQRGQFRIRSDNCGSRCHLSVVADPDPAKSFGALRIRLRKTSRWESRKMEGSALLLGLRNAIQMRATRNVRIRNQWEEPVLPEADCLRGGELDGAEKEGDWVHLRAPLLGSTHQAPVMHGIKLQEGQSV